MSDNNETTADTEYVLHRNDLCLRVAPFGASLRGMWRDNGSGGRTVIITEYSGAKNNVGSQGDVLMPFPSRIPDGRYTFGGTSYQLAPSGSGSRHAMHGFLRAALWEITDRSEEAVTFSITVGDGDFPGYPFALRVTVTYRLSDEGLRCDFRAENIGSNAAPFGAGFHPYFTFGGETINSDILQVPMERRFTEGEFLEVAGTTWDYREPKPAGDAAFDAVYARPRRDSDGLARVRCRSPDGSRSVTVWMDETFDCVVVYSGDTLPPSHQRRALAIEPWTCAPNAFNYPERGLTVLAPGDDISGSWGVVPEM